MSFEFQNPLQQKIIYVFEINAATYRGLLKIGETTFNPAVDKSMQAAAHARIKQYTNTVGMGYTLLHVQRAVTVDHKTFSDHDVHRVLSRSGFKHHIFEQATAREWFKINLPTALNAIDAAAQRRNSLSTVDRQITVEKIIFRPEQNDAINMAVNIFKSARPESVLWNAKMRFGKTLCALDVVRQCRFKRTIIATHRPVVNDAWLEDFNKIFGASDYQFGSKTNGESIENLLKGNAPFVYFASIQDLRGSDEVGGNFKKNQPVFKAHWDLVIIDEAHEGTQTDLGKEVKKALVKKDANLLMLSGTPFNLVEDFDAARTFNWTYIDEQRAKNNFAVDRPTDHNPYADLPRINIRTYDLNRIVGCNIPVKLDAQAFKFSEFFSVDEDDRFVYHDAVNTFIDKLTRAKGYPFSTDLYRQMFRHTFWVLPGVKEAGALCRLLRQHPVFKHFEIVNIAGNEELTGDALKQVRHAIANNNYTITVTCKRLTAGVTVPEWSAVMMLSGAENTSAGSYLQTIFRVQSPFNLDGNIKTDCFVFDFAPDRALNVLKDAVSLNNPDPVNQKILLGELLNFAPVIAFDGSSMVAYDVDKFFRQIKRIQADAVFRKGFDSPLLFKNINLADVDWDSVNKIDKIVVENKTGKKNKIPVNEQGFNKERRKSVGGGNKKPVDTERKKRDKLILTLRAVACKLPLMIYGADFNSDEDISIDALLELIDDRSWEEFMPKELTKELFNSIICFFDEDIFAAASKKLLDTVRDADNMPPPARVDAIAALFATFKNPDKETVLTPWRVVKEHLDLTLNAPDSDFNFDLKLKVLDINSKTGLYPLYAAFNFWRRAFGMVPNADAQRATWDIVIEGNIFALCRTPMAEKITRRTLLGFHHNARANVKCFPNIVKDLRDCFDRKGFDAFAAVVCAKSFWRSDMSGTFKFDAVVGNPPYQEETGNYAKPVYHLFIEAAPKLSDRAALIHPARFLSNAGGTPDKWNKKILVDPHWRIVKYDIDSRNFFPDSDIKGGVAITQYDANADFGSTDIFIAFDELRSIHQKAVVDNKNFQPLSDITYSQTIYRLTKKFHEENPWAIERKTKGHANDVSTNIFKLLPEIFTIEKPDDDREYLQILGLDGRQRVYRYVRRDYITDHEIIDKYKVFVPTANGSGAIGETLSSPLVGSPLVGSPLVITTETFISVGSFDIVAEAEAAFKYIKTKFCRAMLGILKVTQHNTPEKWSKVPQQDFTSSSDIDWSEPIPAIDQQLYAKYGLSAAEIAFIEKHVRAMD